MENTLATPTPPPPLFSVLFTAQDVATYAANASITAETLAWTASNRIDKVYLESYRDNFTVPSEILRAAKTAFEDAGVLVSCEGLHPPSSGARVRLGAGEPTVTDGPFAESRECIGGYWMINVASREEAIAWARKVPAVEPMQIEIRQVQEMDDFPEDVQQAAAGFEQMQTS